MGRRVYVLGGSGSGTSTVARGIAGRLDLQCFDSDDFYWVPTDPPYSVKRPAPERLALMEQMFLARPRWVISGQFHTWAGRAADRLTHVIFLSLPTEERLARLHRREAARLAAWGKADDIWGDQHRAFLEWAAGYDDPLFPGRSRRAQEAWLAELDIPVIRLDAARPQEEVVAAAVSELETPR